jgi:glutamate synthase (NADPH/NADH) small chain
MDFLRQQNRVVSGETIDETIRVLAKDLKVLVIGGGDTGSDCVGTSIRQKAALVTQIEILPKPSQKRGDDNPWPYWPNTLRTSSSHLEGCERRWSLATKRFIGENGVLKGVEVAQVEWILDNGRMIMKEIPGTIEIIEADLVLLSMGFLSPVHAGLLDSLGVEYDPRGNVKSIDNTTNLDKIFVAGDVTRGASLVVWAIRSGRDAAKRIHQFVTK